MIDLSIIITIDKMINNSIYKINHLNNNSSNIIITLVNSSLTDSKYMNNNNSNNILNIIK